VRDRAHACSATLQWEAWDYDAAAARASFEMFFTSPSFSGKASPIRSAGVPLHEIWQGGYFRAPDLKELIDGTPCCYLY
jgi:hypothetical protein